MSIIIDFGMFVLSCFAINMVVNAKEEHICSNAFSQALVWSITCVVILRCSHLIILFLFLFCIAPCAMCCSESCCAVKWIFGGKAVSKKISNNVQTFWTWSFQPFEGTIGS